MRGVGQSHMDAHQLGFIQRLEHLFPSSSPLSTVFAKSYRFRPLQVSCWSHHIHKTIAYFQPFFISSFWCDKKLFPCHVATVTPIQRCTLWKTHSSHLTNGIGGLRWAFLVPSQEGLQYLLWVGLKACAMCQSILIIWTCPSPHCRNAGLVHAPCAVNKAFSVTCLNRGQSERLCVFQY